jgi:hypothetical protein
MNKLIKSWNSNKNTSNEFKDQKLMRLQYFQFQDLESQSINSEKFS